MGDSDIEAAVADHYTGDGGMLERILGAIESAGLDPEALDPASLAGVDEFHVGGRAATDALVADLGLGAGSRVLDVGCGIGGAARTLATSSACSVVGIDVTPAFVEVATSLSRRTGLADLTSFRVGSAMALDVEPGSFDAVTLLHVGMNIDDKHALMTQLASAVHQGGQVAVYDVMRVGDGELTYPVPWAADAESSFVATPDEYLVAMRAAGLEPGDPVSRTALVAATSGGGGDAPPVDLRALVGPDFPARFANLRAAVATGTVAPIQIIAHR